MIEIFLNRPPPNKGCKLYTVNVFWNDTTFPVEIAHINLSIHHENSSKT